jgi:hypothetical protein
VWLASGEARCSRTPVAAEASRLAGVDGPPLPVFRLGLLPEPSAAVAAAA